MNKTIYKNRGQKPVRSASKERHREHLSSSHKAGHSMNIKKKYDSLLGKRSEMSRTKYVKTEEDCSHTNFVHHKKAEQNQIGKFFNSS